MTNQEGYERQHTEKAGQCQKTEWERVRASIFDPNFIIQFLLVICTGGLILVGYWQYGILHNTDVTMTESLHTNRLEQRASIFMQPTGFDRYIGPDRMVSRIWTVQIGNAGKTPTKNLRYAVGCTDDVEKIFSSQSFKDGMVVERHSIGPGITDHSIEGCIRSDAEIDDLIKNRRSLYIFGYAKYEDIVLPEKERGHSTEFCVLAHGFSKVSDPIGDGFGVIARARHCGVHNCTDDECTSN